MIPITFELAVLLAGGSSFFGFFTLAGLPRPYHPVFESEEFRRASIGAFFLSVELPVGTDTDRAIADARAAGASAVELVAGVGAMTPRDRRRRAGARAARPRRPATRRSSTRWRTASRRPTATRRAQFYADGLSMQAPPEGTVPRERITLNPRLTTGREPDGLMQPNGEMLPHYVTTIPCRSRASCSTLGRKRFDITCAHLPRPARRRRQHRRAPDVAAPAAVAAPLRR